MSAANFNVTGRWIVSQSNGFDVHFALAQDPLRDTVEGTATYTPGDVPTIRNGVTGNVIGDVFHVVVSWSTGSKGDYYATLGADGRLRGTTHDLGDPRSQATLISDREFQRL